MINVVDWFITQWSQSGNPAWLKAMMLAAAIAALVFIGFKIKGLLQEVRS